MFSHVVCMAYVLHRLRTKKEVDNVIKTTEDKVLILRFGREADIVCRQMDDIVRIVCLSACLSVCLSKLLHLCG